MTSAAAGNEIELKFQVPAGRLAALTRALATTTAQRIELRARYFDTPDGRLAAAQIALRLRREGERWVQTLKGRGDGLMQRLEDEVPRPPEEGDPPPLDLSLHVGTHAGGLLSTALAGGAAPVARYGTEIQRLKRVLRHGGARIEVALDVGDVVAGDDAAPVRAPVCEVEFELVSGPVSGLLDLAARWSRRFGLLLDPTTKSERAQWLAQGLAMPPVARGQLPGLARGLSLAQARAAMVGASLAHALPNAAAITAGVYGPDHVHQLRVALRRLRSVLRAVGPADADRDAALSALFAALGGTRDADVVALTLAPAWQAARAAGATGPSVPAPDPSPQDGGPAALRQPGTSALWLSLIALTVPAPEGTAAEAARWDRPALKRLRHWHATARYEAARWSRLDDPARHRLRKRLKRVRYLLEFCGPLLPAKAAARESDALRELQDALGHWNDLIVAQAWLATLPPGLPARWFGAGWLTREAVTVEQACREAARGWRRLKGQALVADRSNRGPDRRRKRR